MTCPYRTSASGDRRRAAARGGSLLRACAAGCWLLAAELPDAAMAADWFDGTALRGALSSGSTRWDGVNFGVQAGVTNLNSDFGNGTSSLIAYILRNSTLENEAAPSDWTTLPSNTTNGKQIGAFLGYNMQWDQLVLGLDLAYNRPTSLESSAIDSINRVVTTSDSVSHNVTIAAASSLKLVDYATVRGRAGYAFGQFLPYAVLGGAVGRFNYTNTATVTDVQTAGLVVSTFGPVTTSNNKNNAIVGGFVVGLGMDVALLPNVFLRGEWEMVAFAPVNGIRANSNTGRVGIGVRF
jgi:outer membrane immunogenic protein